MKGNDRCRCEVNDELEWMFHGMRAGLCEGSVCGEAEGSADGCGAFAADGGDVFAGELDVAAAGVEVGGPVFEFFEFAAVCGAGGGLGFVGCFPFAEGRGGGGDFGLDVAGEAFGGGAGEDVGGEGFEGFAVVAEVWDADSVVGAGGFVAGEFAFCEVLDLAECGEVGFVCYDFAGAGGDGGFFQADDFAGDFFERVCFGDDGVGFFCGDAFVGEFGRDGDLVCGFAYFCGELDVFEDRFVEVSVRDVARSLFFRFVCWWITGWLRCFRHNGKSCDGVVIKGVTLVQACISAPIGLPKQGFWGN